MSRVRRARGDGAGAVEALDLVPATSRAHSIARQARADLLAQPGAPLDALAAARTSLDGVLLDPAERARLDVRIFDLCLQAVTASGEVPALQVGGHAATTKGMRTALEESLRRLATLSPDRRDRVRLVDEANTVRPWSLR